MISMGYGDYDGQWDDGESGGVSCACGRHCAEADYAGNPSRGPRAFCETDRSRIANVIRNLPWVYAELSLKLARSDRQQERVSGSREAPVPVDLKVQAFMRHITLVALTWEELVRAACDLSNPDLCPDCEGEGSVEGWECQACDGSGVTRARDGKALARACALLGGTGGGNDGHLSQLLALGESDILRPLDGDKMLCDIEPGSVIRIDSSGDAWQRATRDGTYAGVEFLKLNGRARGMLGLNLQKRRVAVPCDGCDSVGTLKQQEAIGGGWLPVVRCDACPQTYIGAELELLMSREYAAVVAAGSVA